MKSITELVENRINEIAEKLKDINKNGAALEKAHSALTRLAIFYGEPYLFYFSESLIAEFQVDDIKKDGMKILEYLELELGITFNNSQDNGNQRWFPANKYPLRIDLAVKATSSTCKYVQVGVEEVPQYELQCEETEE